MKGEMAPTFRDTWVMNCSDPEEPLAAPKLPPLGIFFLVYDSLISGFRSLHVLGNSHLWASLMLSAFCHIPWSGFALGGLWGQISLHL